MKVMISYDIAGIAHLDEALKSGPDHAPFRDLMTDAAIATCRAAQAAGTAETILRDAHETVRNLDISRLPDGLQVIRGWSGHPYKMVQDLDVGVDALVMVGWHGPAGNGGRPDRRRHDPAPDRRHLRNRPRPSILKARAFALPTNRSERRQWVPNAR